MLNNALFEAVKARHLGVVSALLKRAENLDFADSDGLTLLMIASKGGSLPIVKALLKAGASPLITDREGRTALHWAAMMGHSLVLDVLVSDGSDINAQTRQGITPLMALIDTRHTDAALRFLAHPELELELADQDGKTALDYAASRSMPEVLSVLLERKRQLSPSAEPNLVAKDRFGLTALHQAVRQGDLETLLVLLKTPNVDINARSDAGESVLLAATKSGAMSCVEQLLLAGADPDLAGKNGETPVFEAARLNRQVILELLIKAGANCDAKLRNGQTPLMIAIRERNIEIVRMLLTHGVDLHQRDMDGNGPLTYAAASGLEEVTTLLVEAGADC